MSRLLDVLQELRFRSARVPKQKNIDVAADAMLAIDILAYATKKRERDGRFNVLVTVNRGGNRLDDTFSNPFVPCQRSHLLFILLGQPEGREEVFFFVDVVCLDNRGENGKPIFRIEGSIKIVTVYSCDFLKIRELSEQSK